jgi:outer membrane phospholipase A
MKILLLPALLTAIAQILLGQGTLTILVPPPDSVTPGEAVKISLVVLNPTAASTRFDAPRLLPGKLIVGERSIAVELHADEVGSPSIEAGAFVRHGYVFVMPVVASGLVYLEVVGPDSVPMRTVLLTNGPAAILQENSFGLATASVSFAPAVASLDRTFWNRFGAHEAIYFVYGDNAPAAKFQLSFKYRLRGFGTGEAAHALRALQFGYTQRSLWDINANSSPFYDTSYMPSLFFEAYTPASAVDTGGLTWLGYQSGYQHESNGGAAPASRSLNSLFFRRGLMLGRTDSWHLIVSPRISVYVGGLSDNPNLVDYRGYADWMVALGRGNGVALSYTGRMGKSFDRFSTQLDLTIPVRNKVVDFATYLTLQYFNGYGESLRTYDQRTETLRVGFSLVRLR